MRRGWAHMLDHCRIETYLFAKIAFLLGIAAGATSGAFAAGRDSSNLPLQDIVAIGRGGGKVLLATLASPTDKMQWRFREIPVAPSSAVVRDVQLSVSGTKAL